MPRSADGRVLTAGPWSLATDGSGRQHRLFQHREPLVSAGALVFQFQFFPGPLVLWEVVEETLVLGAAGGGSSLPCTRLGCRTCSFDLVLWLHQVPAPKGMGLAELRRNS